jgi:hypothetical protein
MDIHPEQHCGRILKIKNMKTHVFVICLLSVLAFSSCEDEELTFKRTDYTGNEIRTDGYYYRVMSPDSTLATYIFYYRNGVKLSFVASLNLSSLDQIEDIELIRQEKTMWSVFSVNDSVITTQGWGQPWGHKRPLITSYSKILNDTTIQGIKSINSRTGEWESNLIVRFRKFSPKPDSTNVFIN